MEAFDWVKPVRLAIDDAFEWMVVQYGEPLELMFLPLLKVLLFLQDVLLLMPWYVVLALFGGVAYWAARSLKLVVLVVALLFAMGALGLWDAAMETIALMLVATLFAVVVAIPFGIALSQSNRLQALILPLLDIMQTMPIFVYLIPFVMLFGPGQIPALLATIVFSAPPLIRLTNLGIRQVDKEVLEAMRSFGATRAQTLLSAQLPLAMPTIMAGINQTTMMSLSMVVIASMIGAGGLGYQVLQGIQRLEVSRGLFAGLGIVFIAVVFDRIIQAQGARMQRQA